MKTLQQWVSIYLLLNACLEIASFSNAWVAVQSLPFSRTRTSATDGNSGLWCSRENSDPCEKATTNLSRRSMVRIVASVSVAAATTKLASPPTGPVSAAEVVDPFAAMDDMLSSGTTTGLPLSFGAPGDPVGIGINSPDTENVRGSADANVDVTTTPSPTAQNSDMAAALRESSKKRKIDPRTHG